MKQIDERAEDFLMLEPRMRLELLVDYSERLPPLPERYHAARDAGLNRIQECQSPVFLWIEHDAGRTRIYADAPREAPTVSGFVSFLLDVLEGASTREVAALPFDLLTRLGLAPLLGMTRTRGLTAILLRIKGSAEEALRRESGKSG